MLAPAARADEPIQEYVVVGRAEQLIGVASNASDGLTYQFRRNVELYTPATGSTPTMRAACSPRSTRAAGWELEATVPRAPPGRSTS